LIAPGAIAPLGFFCYSHKDESLRDELEEHLIMLKRQGLLSSWHDRKIGPGTDWKGQIHEKLDSAKLILLLVSAAFLNSQYCYDVELKRSLERHRANEARVIPIILRPCDWKHPPLGDLQALPVDGRPITKFRPRDKVLLSIAGAIRSTLQELAN
jgi:hypothetical protein